MTTPETEPKPEAGEDTTAGAGAQDTATGGEGGEDGGDDAEDE